MLQDHDSTSVMTEVITQPIGVQITISVLSCLAVSLDSLLPYGVALQRSPYMDDWDARFSELLILPQFAQACIDAVHPEHGLKLLRLVRKDVKEALLQYVSSYSLRWELGGSSQPGFVDAIRLLRKTRLSSLRVNIIVDDNGAELPPDRSQHVTSAQIQLFVNELSLSLKHVTDIELRTEILNLPVLADPFDVDPSDDEDEDNSGAEEPVDDPSRPKPMPASLARKLQHTTAVARNILNALALACPNMQRLHVSCPEAPTILPYHLSQNLTTLAVGTCEFRSYVYHAPTQISLHHLHPLLDCLRSLTLLQSSYFEYSILPFSSISHCSSLTYLDCSHIDSTTEMWACLPSGLRELRYRFFDATSTPPPKSASLGSLTRCVISDRSQEWGSPALSGSLMDLLAFAPHMKEVVLVGRSPMHRTSGGLAKLGFMATSHGSHALARLHDQLSAGLKITTERPLAETTLTAQPPSSFLEGFQLQLSAYKEDSDSELEGDDADLQLPQLFWHLHPCPLFTNLLVHSGNSTLEGLNVCFPNLCKLVVSDMVRDLRQFTHLASCTSLQSLEVEFHSGVSPSAMAEAVANVKSLKIFNSSFYDISGGFGEQGRALLKLLLSESSPGLLVNVR